MIATSISGPQPVHQLLDEERARAEIYGLLATLYYAPPDVSLLAALRLAQTQAPTAGAYLEEPWRLVVGQARALSADEIRQEYDSLFVGVGRPDVHLYGSHYISGFLNDKPLIALREDLATLGLARREGLAETEDHIAYLCEVMRYLITGDEVAVCNLAQQQAFFARHLQPWVASLCDAIEAQPQARFYAALAAFTRAFMQVEAQAFDMS